MTDFTRIDFEHLQDAKRKYRRLVDQAEHNVDGQDMLHTAYKLGQFLTEALPDAWTATDLKVPDTP